MKKTEVISLRITKEQNNILDNICTKYGFDSKSKAIRYIINNFEDDSKEQMDLLKKLIKNIL